MKSREAPPKRPRLGGQGQSQQAFAKAVTTEGDSNTPCHATVSLKKGTLAVGVVIEDPGELVIEPYVHMGRSCARIFSAFPLRPPVIVFHHIAAVDSIAVVEYTSASDSHMCSVLTGNPL